MVLGITSLVGVTMPAENNTLLKNTLQSTEQQGQLPAHDVFFPCHADIKIFARWRRSLSFNAMVFSCLKAYFDWCTVQKTYLVLIGS